MARAEIKTICVLPGDGVGPEVLTPSVEILRRAAASVGMEIRAVRAAIGGEALRTCGTPLPDETLDACKSSDAILLGAVGDPAWDGSPSHLRPEMGLLRLRKELGLYGNLRPVRMIPTLSHRSTLKPEVVSGVDMLVVRELTGGLYFGEPRGIAGAAGSEIGSNTMVYERREIERIARKAFESARQRRKKVTSVDKANVLEVSQLWRRVVEEVHADFSDVALNHQYVDNCAMQMVLRPAQFDVLLTENTFGDILSDIGGVLTGSIGTLPSASVGDGPALYEPVHGSAPDIALRDIADPIGAIGCVAMMFEISLHRPDIAEKIRGSVETVLNQGHRTADLCRPGEKAVGTAEFARRVLDMLG